MGWLLNIPRKSKTMQRQLEALLLVETNLYELVNKYNELSDEELDNFRKRLFKLSDGIKEAYSYFEALFTNYHERKRKDKADETLLRKLHELDIILEEQINNLDKFENKPSKEEVEKVLKTELSQEFSNVSILLQELLKISLSEWDKILDGYHEEAIVQDYDKILANQLGFEIGLDYVKDKNTGLIWDRKFSNKDVNWNKAMNYAKEQGKRLPTLDEANALFERLRTVVGSKGIVSLMKKVGFIPDKDTLIWTSTKYNDDPSSYMRMFSFEDADNDSYPKTVDGYILCVRDT